MVDLREMVDFMDRELRTAEVKDYPGAMNGLQLENSGEVTRVVSAVDASLAVVREAAKEKGTLLIVHHGMLWHGAQPITGSYFEKLKAAIAGDLAIYSSHLPLDMHPEFGNNVLLARAIGLSNIRPVLEKNGFPVGMAGVWEKGEDALKSAVEVAVGRRLGAILGGNRTARNVVVITGGAGSMVSEVADAGFDTFVTGEGTHASYIQAEERGLSVLYAGHYATETFGIKDLGERLALEFSIPAIFLERNGGL